MYSDVIGDDWVVGVKIVVKVQSYGLPFDHPGIREKW